MTTASHPWPGQPLSGEQPPGISRVLRQIIEPLARFANPAQSQQAGAQQWGSPGASVTLASSDLLALLGRLYALPQRDRALAFLEGRPHLVALLVEVFGMLHLYFEDVQLVLRLVESEEGGPDQLGVYVLVLADNPDQALARLAAFDEAWWLDAMERAHGELFITVTAA